MGSIKFKTLVELFEKCEKNWRISKDEVKTFTDKYRNTGKIYSLIRLMCPELDKSGRVYSIKATRLADLFKKGLMIPSESDDAKAMKDERFQTEGFSDIVY
jgi:hypothetical protein